MMNNFIRSIILPLAMGSAAAVLANTSSAQALTWNYSITNSSYNYSGSLSLTTAGTTPGANQNYTVTGITGTFNGSNITGLSTYRSADQTFQWDGATGLLLEPSDSISFSTTSDTFNIDSANASLHSQQEPADSIRDSNLSRYFGGLSANLTSVTAAAVPFDILGGATIPALGSLLALGGMRKARKKVSNNISNSVTKKII